MDAKLLILKGLGKAKVRCIIKNYMILCFNDSMEYNYIKGDGSEFTFPLYQTIYNNGLPEMPEDEPFTIGELVEFVGNKI